MVPLLDAVDVPPLAAGFYRDGDPGPIVRSLAHVPELLEVAMPFVDLALGPTGIFWRTKILVIVRMSARAQCRYCIQTHSALALDAGLSREEILALRLEADCDKVFNDPRERVVIAWSDVAAEFGPASPTLRVQARRYLAHHEIVELTVLAGATLMLNRLATMLELPAAPATLDRLRTEGLELR